MTMESTVAPARSDVAATIRTRILQWSPIFLGALCAAALSFILVTFGTTVGLGVTSTAPTWRDASAALWILSGIYLIIQAILSFGVGGYITGRARASAVATPAEETEHID